MTLTKHYFLLYLSLLGLLRGAAQGNVTYFSTDFSNGLPTGCTTYDQDKQTLYFSMVQAGFDQGDAWKCLREEGTKNYYAASASKYKVPAGEELKPSDDWLVLPPVNVLDAEARLSWRANSFSQSCIHGDRYEVRVSTAGNRPEDFTAPPVLTVEEEKLNLWTQHEIPLAEYAGKQVYIAFVNTTLDGEILAIDDIRVEGGTGQYCLVSDIPSYVFQNEGFKPSGRFVACGDKVIDSFEAVFSHDGKEVRHTFTGLQLQPGDTLSFELPSEMDMTPGDTVNYKLSVTAPDDLPRETEGMVVGLLFPTTRRTVIEEATGMWCVYCPLGIVAMNRLHKKYPESFIGVAIHYEDPMAMDDYVKELAFNGFPSGWINRRYLKNPMEEVETEHGPEYTMLGDGFETWFLTEQQRLPEADLTLAVSHDNGVKAEATIRFASPAQANRYNLFCVAVEDSVSDDAYYQDNGFAGSTSDLDGFETLPHRIHPFVFQEVARATNGAYRGTPILKDIAVKAGETHTVQTAITLPDYANPQHVAVVALLLDRTTGEVVNAARCALYPETTEAGWTETAAGNGVLSWRNGCCTLPGTAATTFALYGADGRLWAQHTTPAGSEARFRLPALPGGVYVVKARRGTMVWRMRMAVR